MSLEEAVLAFLRKVEQGEPVPQWVVAHAMEMRAALSSSDRKAPAE